MPSLATRARMLLRPRGREAFVQSLPIGAAVLDVGCGSNSPYLLKSQRPDLHYVGIDVFDYDQDRDPNSVADEYIVCEPAQFGATIAGLGQRFDAVISSHNIEHCDDPEGVLAAMAGVIKPGGRLYMAWPAEHTVTLPSRAGCLNFYDDPGHRQMPQFASVLGALYRGGLVVSFQARAYHPVVPYLVGAVVEPFAAALNRQGPLRSTWAFYGFESVVWLSKTA